MVAKRHHMVRRGHARRERPELFWVRYSFDLVVSPPAAQQVLLDANAFDPSSTGVYSPETNHVATVHRIKLNYVASFEQFGPAGATSTVVYCALGIRVGDAAIRSPAVGAFFDQRADWLDLWLDAAASPPVGTGNVSFNTGEQGQTSRDVKSKRRLPGGAESGLFLEGAVFGNNPGSGNPTGDDLRYFMSCVVSMLVSRTT